FAALFHHLCASGYLSVSSRYIFLLTGGCLLAGIAMGSYAVLLHIPATGSMLVLLYVSPARAHTWVFALQMSWQTLCHLVLRGTSSSSRVPSTSRPAVALPAIMLFTQKATSLALDIHEGLMPLQLGQGLLKRALPLCSYLLFFPALLGGPLCSFTRFKAPSTAGLAGGLATGRAAPDWAACPTSGHGPCSSSWPIRTGCWMRPSLKWWASGQWQAGETLLSTTTHRLAIFTQTWNKSTSCCLRRLVFQRCPAQPLLVTFAFSAWWHGLWPGHVFGFLCWAVMVEADYRSHPFLGLLYRGTTWVFTQLIVAYILVAVETFSMLCLLWTSCDSILPLSCGLMLLLLLLLAKKLKQN
uniref:Membrane bound O-acyltransferase domain containing 4 n=1 Tax=Buteo japonicus TaxID=224669 RepID=A0A8B9Z7Q0_9AVES